MRRLRKKHDGPPEQANACMDASNPTHPPVHNKH